MNRFFKWIQAVFWTAFIVYALLSPSDGIPLFPWMDFAGFDKLAHAVLFAVEAIVLSNAITNQKNSFTITAVVFMVCTALGGGLELLQHYTIDGRNGDILDLLADVIGALLGLAGVYFFDRRLR